MSKWKTRDCKDGYTHHYCPNCKNNAIYDFLYIEDYDEDIDGEWYSIGLREYGINEHLTKYCPECGEFMEV